MYGRANREFRLKVPTLRGWPELKLRLPRWSTLAYLLLPLAAYAALHTRANLVGKVRVRGYMVERGAPGVTALRAYSQEWPRQYLTVRAGPYAMRYTRAELGASMPTERVCARILGLDRVAWTELDLASLWRADSRGLELQLSPVIAQTTLVAQMSELRRRVEHMPVPGMIMGDGNVLPGIPGFTLDLVDAVETVARALNSDQLEVELNGRSVAPPAPERYGSESVARFAYKMVTFETKYRTAGPAAGRAHNVEMAAAHLESVVIPPRGELSFNAVVGERSYARGFSNAKEIAARRIVDGVGGGVCQVAATLHAAAFLGGFDLPEYQPHSRPAHYIDFGLDTMVSWPAQDMRIANPYPFPVRVRASARDGVLRITLEGSGKAHFVDWNTRILARVRAGTQELIDDTLAADESEVIQEAIDGLTVRRVRTVYLPTGPRREESILKYPPNDRIVAVGSRSAHARSKLASSERISRLVLDDF
jgi:vancomycin resistance protein YoaR